jgi:outer membrane receptor protein involved in Fe transport
VWQVGGDGILVHQPEAPEQKRITGFLHVDYDVSDSLNLHFEALGGWSNNTTEAYPNYEFGQFGFTIFNDNAYLPAAVKSLMATSTVSSFAFGRDMKDMHLQEVDPFQRLQRYEVGAKKTFGADWTLEGYYTHAQSQQDTYVNYIPNLRNLYAAADAVVNPANGQIVCRSTLSGLDPGCVPLNLFGDGSVSKAASDFVLGSSDRFLTLKEDIVDVNLSGILPEGFSLGAGPISVATGATYRKEGSNQTSDAVSQSTTVFTGLRGAPAGLNNRPGGYQTFNPLPLSGSYNVTEGFVEAGIPLLKERPLARSLDLNLAARLAHYSTSGNELSWKAGLTWRPIDSLLFRLSDSRDVRAPNITELFNPRSTNAANVVYNGVTTGYTGFTVGNPDLKPEIGHTLTGGVVYTPPAIPGLNVSVDGFDIQIDGAIGQLGAQAIVDQCARGAASLCALIQNNGAALVITNPSLNLSKISVRGLDFESSYGTGFLGGRLNLRVLATYLQKYTTETPGAPPTDTVDALNSRSPWSGTAQVAYAFGPLTATLQERFIGATKFNGLFVEGIDVNNNHVPARAYTDLTVQYALREKTQVFVGVSNLFNRAPPPVPVASTFQQPTNPSLYDTIGTYFTAGIRARY